MFPVENNSYLDDYLPFAGHMDHLKFSLCHPVFFANL